MSPAQQQQQKKKNGYMCLFIDKLMLIEPVAIIITVVLTITIIIRLKYTSTPMNSAKNMVRKYAVIAWEEFFPIVEI